ncbi:transcription factor S [Candidatus Woesearchaeota archaeon]|nr:MAG: transcription factor S [Candidatus Woesearchaeota archaeon]
MMFCPKCGSILVPKKDGDKKKLVCSCGFTTTEIKDAKIVEIVKKKEKEFDVVDIKKEEKTLPLTDAKCDKCGHNKAYYWTIQTRASDEPETKFLRCEKCKHTWREYT